MKKKVILAILILAVFLSGVMTASAFSGNRKLDAYFKDIKVIVDGREVDLMDANGNPVEPFIVNGSTYLPVRGVVNAITGGTVAIEWDPINYRVLIGDCKTGKVEIQDFVNTWGQSVGRSNSDGSYKFFNRGVEIVPYNSVIFDVSGSHSIPLEGRYSRITGAFTAQNYAYPLSIYGDDVLLGTFVHNGPNDAPTIIDLPLIGVRTLKFVSSGRSSFYNVDIERLD